MAEARRLGSTYVLDRILGNGTSGQVWAGHDNQGRPWAFKLLHADMARDPDVVRRFVQERELLASIRDVHVVGVHDLVTESGTLAIVMDLVLGGDLRSLLRAQRTLPPGLVARTGAQIARGLAAVHARGALHRDVKPENVLLDDRTSPPTARLTDLGVAKIASDGQHRTMILGTPHYMAPEVTEGAFPTPESDLYSLGVMLYEICCGTTPFGNRTSTMAVLRAHSTERPGRPPGIPDPLWQLIESLVDKSPYGRPSSALDAANRLEALATSLAHLPAAVAVSSPPPTIPIPPPEPTMVTNQPQHEDPWSNQPPPEPTVVTNQPFQPQPWPSQPPPAPPQAANMPGPGMSGSPYQSQQTPYASGPGISSWMSGDQSVPAMSLPQRSLVPPPPRAPQRSTRQIGLLTFAAVLALGLLAWGVWYVVAQRGGSTPATSTLTHSADQGTGGAPPTEGGTQPTGPKPASGSYQGTARQYAQGPGVKSGVYTVAMSFRSTGSAISYRSGATADAPWQCAGVLRPDTWVDGKRTYVEVIDTDPARSTPGRCGSGGTWAVDVRSDTHLHAEYHPPGDSHRVEVDLERVSD